MKLKGSVTLFLSYLSIFTIAVLGSFADSARISTARAMMTDDGLLAAQNILAEYEREIFDDYHVFFVDASELDGDEGAKRKADEYLKTMNEPLTSFSPDWMGTSETFSEFNFTKGMTENNCQYFVEQAVKYGQVAGLADLADELTSELPAIMIDPTKMVKVADNSSGISTPEIPDIDVNLPPDDEIISGDGKDDDDDEKSEDEKKKKDALQQMKDILAEAGAAKSCALGAILPAGATISTKKIDPPEWNVTSEGNANDSCAFDSVVFLAYINHCYNDFLKKVDEKEHALDYEKEYIIEGKNCDRDNLFAVGAKIYGLRLGAWFLYYNNPGNEVYEAAEATATGIAGILGMPELIPAIREAIILIHAAIDARKDCQTIFGGGKVDLVPKSGGTKIGYKEFLDIFLGEAIASGKANSRSVKIVEANMRVRYKQDFRADSCFSGITAEADGKVEPRFFSIPIITRLLSKTPGDFTHKIAIEADLN